jgi:hypothetical protein
LAYPLIKRTARVSAVVGGGMVCRLEQDLLPGKSPANARTSPRPILYWELHIMDSKIL